MSDAHSIVNTDVLVVGSGLAGMQAALAAAAGGVRVALIDKAAVGKSGATRFSAGDIQCFYPDQDDLLAWIGEVAEGSAFMADQSWLETVYQEVHPRLREMESVGVRFETEDGRFRRHTGRGKVTRYVIADAAQMLVALRREARRRGVQLFNRSFLVDLLVENERVVGALTLGVRDARPLVFQARSVVLAAGGCSFRGHSSGERFATGDAFAAAYRAGATLAGMEVFALRTGPARYSCFMASNQLVGLGARFINALGEPFMERFDPAMTNRAHWHVQAQAIANEVVSGRGPVYLDMRSMSEENYQTWAHSWPMSVTLLGRAGIDPRRDLIEWSLKVAGQTDPMCGIVATVDGVTSLPGLLAVGDAAASGHPGFGYGFGGLNLANCVVAGYRSGLQAAESARSASVMTPSAEDMTERVETVFRPLNRPEGVSPDDVYHQIQRAIFPYSACVVKNVSGLERALSRVGRIKKDLAPAMSAADPHQLIKAHETQNTLLSAEMFLRASLYRTESRGAHQREDYPERDDAHWLKLVVARKEHAGISIGEAPLAPGALKHLRPV